MAQECRDGCFYSNTYQGVDALPYETIGGNNTALGYLALNAWPDSFVANTAVGAWALAPGSSSILRDENTAVGVMAMQYSGSAGHAAGAHQDTAVGVGALTVSSGSYLNTAVGAYALNYDYFDFFSAQFGVENTAIGAYAISGLDGSFGSFSTAIGASALPGADALYNTADGYHALYNDSLGGNNLAEGNLALSNNTAGGSNIAVGDSAGINLTTGSNNIEIGNKGVAGEANTIRLGKKGTQTATYIAGVRGTTVAGGVGVLVGSNGRLGTINSSTRYKENIQPMGKASEAILLLQPVMFRYKHELDPESIPQFGLVAEQVEKVNPDLVARDDQGKAYTVRYEAVNAMLLNEFIKRHRQGEEQGTEINQLASSDTKQTELLCAHEKEITTLTQIMKEEAEQIQKVSDQLTLSRPAPRVVINNP
jgi:hypothetical protein